jgi:hypothetical protein
LMLKTCDEAEWKPSWMRWKAATILNLLFRWYLPPSCPWSLTPCRALSHVYHGSEVHQPAAYFHDANETYTTPAYIFNIRINHSFSVAYIPLLFWIRHLSPATDSQLQSASVSSFLKYWISLIPPRRQSRILKLARPRHHHGSILQTREPRRINTSGWWSFERPPSISAAYRVSIGRERQVDYNRNSPESCRE